MKILPSQLKQPDKVFAISISHLNFCEKNLIGRFCEKKIYTNCIYVLKSIKLQSIKPIINFLRNKLGEVNRNLFFISVISIIAPLILCFITFGAHQQVQGNQKVIFHILKLTWSYIYIYLLYSNYFKTQIFILVNIDFFKSFVFNPV